MASFVCPNCRKEIPVRKCEYGSLAACCNLVLYFRPEMKQSFMGDPATDKKSDKPGERPA